jgi:hypothetical protein
LRNELTEGRRRPGLHTLAGAAIRLRPLLVLAGLIALVGQVVLLLPFAFEHTELAIDAVQLQAAGERIRADAPIYWHWADYGPDIDAPGGRPRPLETTAYPPLLLPIFALLPDVPFATFARVWAVLLVGGLWLYAASIARIVAGRTTIGGVLIAGFFLALIPGGGTNVKQGNIDPLLWAAYGWALALPRAQGAGLSLVASVKVFFVWPLLLTVRDRRTWRDAAVVFASLGALAVVIMGPASFLQACVGWFREVPAYHGQGTFRPWNVSLSFAVIRVARLLGWDYETGPLPTGWHIYLVVTGIVAPAVAAYTLRRRSRELRQAGVVCGAVLFSPICWLSYMPLVLPVAAIWLRTLLTDRESVTAVRPAHTATEASAGANSPLTPTRPHPPATPRS